ncbi:MAG TPA: N-carbamoylputrescine amidase [Lichenihabitans sp.]|jgi:N-carbamoylputrescine amidase|nr:N-carbamoylputrescine amidase [Lichenihabitans sp.]
MRTLQVAALQFSCGEDRDGNVATAERLIREAAKGGAQLVLLPELFETPYFAKSMRHERYALAAPIDSHPTLHRLQTLAADLRIVLPVSFYERANNAFFNSVAVFDADGTRLGLYRKSHIPDAPGYLEKYYFSPGDTGFRVWRTRYATLGVGICWDQWFPETARALALQGADLIVYPTAIGTDIDVPSSDSSEPWTRVMQGHAAANCVGVVAANRVGAETDGAVSTTFFGRSFIADETGRIVAEADRQEEAVVIATLDLDRMAARRDRWGVFRDRRPELYGALLSLDGRSAERQS